MLPQPDGGAQSGSPRDAAPSHPFLLFRNFVAASVLAIAAVTLVGAYLFVRLSDASFRETAEHRSAQEAVHFAALFYKSVWAPSLQKAPGGAIHDLDTTLTAAFAHDIAFGLSIVRVSVFDLEGTLVYTTDARVTGISDLAAAALYRRVVGQGVTSAVLEQGQSVTLPTGERSLLDVINTFTPLTNAPPEAQQEGNFVGILHMSQDVTRDLAQARAQAVRTAVIGSIGTGVALFALLFLIVFRADRQLSRQQVELERAHVQTVQAARLSEMGLLVSGVAHELNNPLTGISGLSDLLLRRKLDTEAKEEVSMIHEEAQRSIRIVQGLLAFARPSVAEKAPVSLNTAVESVLNLLQYELATQNIQVAADLDPHLPLTLADLHAIQQVVMNLVINAEQAMVATRRRGHLWVRTEQVGPTVRIVIRDDGPGIPRQDLARIFEPFYTTKEVGKGTGLGLSICFGIVQEHGGAIRVVSEPGHGATFIVELPLAGVEAPASTEGVGTTSPGRGTL